MSAVPDLLAYSGPVVCLVVLGLLVVESGLFVGVFLPGDSLLFGAGLLVGNGPVDAPVAALAASAWLGAVLGDSLGYGLGRRFGRSWLTRGWKRGGPRFLATAERMYARHGWFAIVICRWYPGVRALVPTLAGMGRMHRVRFACANALGALLWAVGMVLLGHTAAAFPWVRDAALWAMAVSVAASLTYTLVHLVRRRVPRAAGAGAKMPTGAEREAQAWAGDEASSNTT